MGIQNIMIGIVIFAIFFAGIVTVFVETGELNDVDRTSEFNSSLRDRANEYQNTILGTAVNNTMSMSKSVTGQDTNSTQTTATENIVQASFNVVRLLFGSFGMVYSIGNGLIDEMGFGGAAWIVTGILTTILIAMIVTTISWFLKR